jgi:glyoxylase-like metal-dependent hydrolase (beta-lactamase superfamily II)
MDVLEIDDGLWRWTAFHEEWNEQVGCVYVETEDGVVLIDPLVPVEDTAKFWKALDRDVKKQKGPVHVFITVFWHARSAAEMRERYDARIWAPSAGKAALVPGDVLLADGKGGARMCPESWLPASKTHRDLAASLRPLLDLPVRRVLVSHGRPVLTGGGRALARALEL